jgi:RNA polymerase sigma factor (sigma-70 family)
VARLYRDLSGPLERIVRRTVRSPDTVVDDACQFAWSRLIQHRARLREETALGWLARTAVHEAFKLSRRNSRELSLDEALDQGIDPVATTPEPWELLAQRERVGLLAEIEPRPRRMIWLRALGFSYAEMAAHERCTPRTVERQLTKARSVLREQSVTI